MSHDHEIPGHDWFDGGVGAQDLTAPTIVVADQEAITGSAFSYTPTSSDAGVMTFSLYSGTLPGTMTINSATGEISGVATILATYSGIRILVVDDAGNSTISDPFSIAVVDVPALAEMLYSRGSFKGSVTIAGESVTSPGSLDSGYVSKHYADGTAQWVATVESTGEQTRAWQLAVDPSDASVIAAFTVSSQATVSHPGVVVKNADGTTFDTITDVSPVVSVAATTAVIGVRYDADGNVQWAKRLLDWTGTENGSPNSTLTIEGLILDGDDVTIVCTTPQPNTPRTYIVLGPGDPNEHTKMAYGSGQTPGTVLQDEEMGAYSPFYWTFDKTTGEKTAAGPNIMYGSYNYGAGRLPNYNPGAPVHNVTGPVRSPDGTFAMGMNNPATPLLMFWAAGRQAADRINFSNANQTYQRFQIYDGGGLPLELMSTGVVKPSTTPAGGGSSNSAGSLTRPFADGSFLMGYWNRALAGYNEVRWWGDADTVLAADARDSLFSGVPDSICLAHIDADALGKSWSRAIPNNDSAQSDYMLEDAVLDEANGYGYLVAGVRVNCWPEWDGTSENDYHQTEGGGVAQSVFLLLKFDLSTGNTVWWAVASEYKSALSRFSISLTDEHVVLSVRQDMIDTNVPNGWIARNSNLDYHRPQVCTLGDATNSWLTHVVRYTKSSGMVVDVNETSRCDASTEFIDGKGFIPPPISGYATEPAGPAANTFTPGQPVFSAEAVAAQLRNPVTGLGQFYTDGPQNIAITDRLLTPLTGGNHVKSTTGGPGGGTVHNVPANLPWFGSIGTNAPWSRASSSLAQPGVVLLCGYADAIGTRQVLFCGTLSNWEIAINASGYLELNAGTLLTATGTALTAGSWFWAAFKVDGNSSEIACSVAQSASGAAGSNALDDIRIMSDPAQQNGLVGRFNSVKVWDGIAEWAAIKTYAAVRWDTL